MNNKPTLFNWLTLGTVLFIFIAGLWFGCQKCGIGKGSKRDTISVKTDTVFIQAKDTIAVPYETLVPYKVIYWKEKTLHDTLETFETVTEKVDTSRILNQYFAKRYYTKTSPVQYGTVTIKDTVTQNRVTGRSITLDQKIPVVKETVTLERPKKLLLLVGITAMGNKQYLPYATGLTLDLKLKNDGMIGIGGYVTGHQPMYSLSLKFPLKKKAR